MRIANMVCLVCALVLWLATPTAHAAFTLNVEQVVDSGQSNGADVTVSGSGSFNITGLTAFANVGPLTTNSIHPAEADASIGGTGFLNEFSVNFTGAGTFGSSTDPAQPVFAGGSGTFISFSKHFNVLELPTTYLSGSVISDSCTFTNKTLASMNLFSGIYTESYPVNGTTDVITVDIFIAPEPSCAGVITVPALLFLRRRRVRCPRLSNQSRNVR